MAVAISWEIFFGGRVNDGVKHGGSFIINPTNGSSYTWTVLQSQQVASSRLRAMEQGRWVVQAAPTGFSAFIAPDGTVIDRTSVSEQEVITGTPPWVLVMALLLGCSWITPGRAWRERRRAAAAGPEVSLQEPESA
jgi:apolipoprotein N-acyltransferase